MSVFIKRAKYCVAFFFAAGLFVELTNSHAAGYKVQRIASGLDQPVQVVQAPGDMGSIYVLENQTNDFMDNNGSGQIIKVDLATGAKSSFLRVEDIHKPSQGGLHGLVFHPDFQTNRKFYLSWVKNHNEGDELERPRMRLDEYEVQSGVPVITRTLFDKPNLSTISFHGINWLGFKPGATGVEKDYLFVTHGDGGIPADAPTFTAESQDLSSVRGKVLRIDVNPTVADAYPNDPTRNYGIPTGNPYAEDGDPDTLAEIYHSGLRNPWRASFDRETGDLYIGDVGFDSREEINFAKAGEAGLDFGWSKREGTIETTFNGLTVPGVSGEQGDSLDPIFELLHDTTQEPVIEKRIDNVGSITGGQVYRGPITELQGQYFFAEARAGEVLSGTFDRSTEATSFDGNNLNDFTIRTDELNALIEGEGEINVIVSFDEDASGHLYLSDFSDGGFQNNFNVGEIYRLIPDLPADFNDDGFVDAADEAVWEASFGYNGGADADGDGDSDGADFLAWQRATVNLTVASSLSASIPEPTTLGLLATAWTVLAGGRRRC